ncbi:MAG: type II toxin-antitoxin system VapC family toxin [Chloroflexota bacterium]
MDANLLIYAYDTLAPQHQRVREWLEAQLSGPVTVGLPWSVLLAFLRIVTHPRIFDRPATVPEASEFISSLLMQPAVTIPQPGRRYWQILSELTVESDARGNLVPDAALAALAIEHGATMCTADRDFRRFRGLKLFDPLADPSASM